MTETTKNKAASPCRGLTAQNTTSFLNSTPFAFIRAISWLDVSVNLCFLAIGALLGSLR